MSEPLRREDVMKALAGCSLATIAHITSGFFGNDAVESKRKNKGKNKNKKRKRKHRDNDTNNGNDGGDGNGGGGNTSRPSIDPAPAGAERIRVDIRTYNEQQMADFVAAINEMKRMGEYDRFVPLHDSLSSEIHKGPKFFPAHRGLIKWFEDILLQINPDLKALPYWKFDEGRGNLFTTSTLGPNGDPNNNFRVTAPPFGHWNPHRYNGSTVEIDPIKGVRRQFTDPLPTPAQVDQIFTLNVYDAAPWDTSVFTFRNVAEGWWNGPQIHNLVHVRGGGALETLLSPDLIEFWLLHNYLNLLWRLWQQVKGKYNYQSPGGLGERMSFLPGNPEVREFMDEAALGIYYA